MVHKKCRSHNSFLIFLIVLVLLLIIPSVFAATEFGYNNLNKPTLSKTVVNYTEVNVNKSLYWNDLSTPADIDHNLLNNLAWSVAGHIIDTAFLPDTTLIYDIGSGALRWGDLYVSDISADDISAYDIDLLGEITSPAGNFTSLFVDGVNVVGDANITGLIYGNGSQLTDILSSSLWETDGTDVWRTSGDVGIFGSSHSILLDVGTSNKASLYLSENTVGNSKKSTLLLHYDGNNNLGKIMTTDNSGIEYEHLTFPRTDRNVYLPTDGAKLYFGGGQNSSITYDGTNMVFSSKEQGNGYFDFNQGEVVQQTGTDKMNFVSQRTGTDVGQWAGYGFVSSTGDGLIRQKAGIAFERTGDAGVGSIHFLTTTQGVEYNVNLSDTRMTITRAGNVGIGTTTPTHKLNVVGDTNITGNLTVGNGFTGTCINTTFVSGIATGCND